MGYVSQNLNLIGQSVLDAALQEVFGKGFEITKTDTNDSMNVYFGITDTKHKIPVCSFFLSEMPACCGAILLNRVVTYERRRGWGTKAVALATLIAKKTGFSSMAGIVAVRDGIYTQNHEYIASILTKQGWERMKEGPKNLRSGNRLDWWHKDLQVPTEIKKAG